MKKRGCLVILSFIFPLLVFSQNFADKDYYLVDSLEIDKISETDKALIDSCLILFYQAKDDTNRIHIINTIVDEVMGETIWPKYNWWVYNFAQQQLQAHPAEKVKRKLTFLLARSMHSLGSYQYGKGDYRKALSWYKKSLKISETFKDKKFMASTIGNIASIKEKQGDIPSALEYFHKNLNLRVAAKDSLEEARTLNNIGSLYFKQGEIDFALEYFHKSLKIVLALKDEYLILTTLNNIGASYYTKRNFPKAIDYYTQSIAMSKKLNYKTSMSDGYNNLGKLYQEQQEYQKAFSFYLEAIEISKELGDKERISRTSVNIARFLFDQGKKREAKKYAQLGFDLAEEIKSPLTLQYAAELLSQLYAAEGKGMKALELYKLYVIMHDSLNNIKNTKAIIQQNAKYQYQQEKAIDDKERDILIAIEQKEKEKQTIITYATGAGLVLVLSFLVFVFNRLRITREQKQVIGEQKQKSEELLLNILPKEIADELKDKGVSKARLFDNVTVLFTDFKGFTSLSEVLSPAELVEDLNTCFSAFDHIMEKYNIEKIKTIGDAYMAAGGLPTISPTHASDTVNAALEIKEFMLTQAKKKKAQGKPFFEIRIGVHSGPLVAGVVGVKKFQYDIWGDTVNTASRMESSGEVGEVNISESTYELLQQDPTYQFVSRGKIKAKGKGELEMYFVRLKSKAVNKTEKQIAV